MKTKKSCFAKENVSQKDFEAFLTKTFGEGSWIKREKGPNWSTLCIEDSKPMFKASSERWFYVDYLPRYNTELWRSLSLGRYLLGQFSSDNGKGVNGKAVLFFDPAVES